MSPASIPACGGIELAVRGGWVLRVHLSDWWAPSLGWRSNRHPASALCGLPFLFLLCGIVAALRLLAVGLGRYVVSSRLFCCPVLYERVVCQKSSHQPRPCLRLSLQAASCLPSEWPSGRRRIALIPFTRRMLLFVASPVATSC